MESVPGGVVLAADHLDAFVARELAGDVDPAASRARAAGPRRCHEDGDTPEPN
jgi:hypothetical protein